MRIGLTQRVEVIASYGERRDCLDQAWARLLTRQGMLPVPLCNSVDIVERYVLDLDLDGVILTGGNDLAHLPGATRTAPERDLFERRLLRVAADRRLPVLGVCRGMQMMVAAGGGELVRVEGHVAVRHATVANLERPAPLCERNSVNSYHDFGVRSNGLGTDWELLATAPDGTVEAIAHRRLPHWAVMWHPERSPYDERDLELFRELFGRGER